MTSFEKQQPRSVFISAGDKSFKAGIEIGNNPYHESPFREAWARGFSEASDRFFGTTFRKKNATKFIPNRRSSSFPVSRTASQPRPAISLGKANYFNNKNRTAIQGVIPCR